MDEIAEAQLRRLAYRDGLTGLPNREATEARVATAVERAAREGSAVVLLLVNLDGMRLVNETLGRAHGDDLLRAAADRVRAVTGPSVVAGRHGGDEFVVICEDLPHDRDTALTVARDQAALVADAFSTPFAIGGAQFELTISTGAAAFPWHARDAAGLLSSADGAMHAAKADGRARAVVSEAVAPRPLRDLEATLQVRRAMDAGQLELHYQPVIEIADGGGLGGLEALIRWRDPDRGLVPPGAFLPLVEHTPLMEELTAWVYRELCRQLAEWRGRGFEPRVSFNVPARQLRSQSFADLIEREAAATGADLTRIAAEVTETANADLSEVQVVLMRLRAAGLVLSLDDFGTGYSSFSRLREMPFSLLKTDRSFMQGVPEDPVAAELLASMVRLGAAMGLVVIVEGVETEAQRDRLLDLGVRVAQGFLFGRPLPAAEVEARYAVV